MVGLEDKADPLPVLRSVVEMVVPHLSAPPTREMELSYTPSELRGPDACDVLREEDVEALLGGPSSGFAGRQADLAERQLFLNNGKVTYFTRPCASANYSTLTLIHSAYPRLPVSR